MDLDKRLDGAAEFEDPEYDFFKQNTPCELDIVGSSSEVEDYACEVWEESDGALSRAEGFSAKLVPLRCLRFADLLLLLVGDDAHRADDLREGNALAARRRDLLPSRGQPPQERRAGAFRADRRRAPRDEVIGRPGIADVDQSPSLEIILKHG